MVFAMHHRVFYGQQEIVLTKRQYQVLDCLVRNRDLILSREQLLVLIWGYDYLGDSDILVNTHISRIRTKIAEHTDRRFIDTVHGFGYRFNTMTR